ncbi:hypothetical protein BJF92_20920 [Rhizobium rhizosphaerae]|uniref:DUF1003 domain-containing protein n=1 Tax=Xaviernesmea rhizosphaerae TaxID=1672749 RepID=A0A1Q9ANK9_9HYPH|nr:DUF1003 domain-containing protein [Xaviernesmea rhizosphaerae]OLP56976.1 hypothetical protein BJF92_20920 [Xaviernesmea rhizosphaerae]OQP87176.1 hypothetical protein BTR14_07060 [Xaviernesmea rhizosphaerae]
MTEEPARADHHRGKPAPSPTQNPEPALSPTLARNIAALIDRRRAVEAEASLQEKAAAAISRFAGSMVFVYIHLVLFGGWILLNLGLIPAIPAWDPTLVVLAMIASVEAIFLSTFVLINQNRMAAQDDARADLDLQVNLLNEHETTRLIAMVDAIARHLEVAPLPEPEIEEMTRDVAPDAVMDAIAAHQDGR